MGRWSFAAAMMLLAAGCNVTLEGKVVDGMTGEVVAGRTADTPEGKGMRIMLKAVKTTEDGKVDQNMEAGALCLVKEGLIDENGAFTVPDVCTSASDYSIELSDKNLFLAEVDSLTKGYEGGAPLELKVWRAPKGTGVFKLAGSELSRVSSATDVRSDFVFKSEETVISPKEIKAVPLIAAGEHLLMAGGAASYDLIPLINSDKRRLGKEANAKREWVDQQPWSYVGVEFKSDTEIERKTVTVDAAKVITKEKGNRVAKYLAADAVPAGRYMILKEGAKRGWIVDFGEAGKAPGAE